MEELQRLIQEGEVLVRRLEQLSGQSAFLSAVRVAVCVLQTDVREFFEDVNRSVKFLSLPSPVYDLNREYVRWTGACRDMARKSGWLNDDRFNDFTRLSREFGKEMTREKPRYQLLIAHVDGQVSLLRSLLRDGPAARSVEREAKTKTGRGWSTRKVLFSVTYLVICAIIDWLAFPLVGLYVVPILGVEIAVLLGLPKLVEWLRK